MGEHDGIKKVSQHFPRVLDDWARSAKRHALDPHLEDVQSLLDQGNPDPAEDMSFRGLFLPPNEKSNGKRRLEVISARPGHAQAVADELLQGEVFVESVEIERPGREAMEHVLGGMRDLVAPALPCAGVAVESGDGVGDERALEHPPRSAEVPIAPLPAHYARDILRGPAPVQVPSEPPQSSAPVGRRVEPQPGRPFVLCIREGRRIVDHVGPFAKIGEAIDARNERGEPGQVATVYAGAKVAQYRGYRQVFSFGRTNWSRV